jgi:uncharacterized protein YqeY
MIRDRLREALTDALKARDRETANVVRSALAAIGNAEAVEVGVNGTRAGAIEESPVGLGAAEVDRHTLTEVQIAALIRAEIVERQEAARTYEHNGAEDQAARLRREAQVLIRLGSGSPSGITGGPSGTSGDAPA